MCNILHTLANFSTARSKQENATFQGTGVELMCLLMIRTPKSPPDLCWTKSSICMMEPPLTTLLMGLGLVQLLFWLLAKACQGPYISPAMWSRNSETLHWFHRQTLAILLNEHRGERLNSLEIKHFTAWPNQ